MSHRAAPTPAQPRRHHVFGRLVIVGLMLFVAVTANAQEEAQPDQPSQSQTQQDQSEREPPRQDGAERAKPQLAPPKLVTFSEADYPQEAEEKEVEGAVVLILTLDREGTVVEAQVEKGLGHGLDEAAREAAMQFVFEPARRDGTAIPARIRFTYEFELPDQPAEPEPTEPKAADSADEQSADEQSADEQSADEQSADEQSADEQAEPQPKEPTTIAITVKGKSAGEKLQESARSVEVIDTEEASRESSDMGEVLARKEGIGVRRSGGLGSGTRFSLNGLNDKQVRFFLDGVPLEFAGFPMGIANVPVNLIERVDVYSGVVPIHLGADALGGAVDLISPALPEENGLRASYQFGSFSTHRLALSGRAVSEDGLFVRGDTFFDYADNDYDIDVEVASDTGQISEATVERFHDGYRAFGGGLEVGVADKPWAERLSLRLFGSDLSRDLQHNLIMSVPYGDVVWGQTVAGATAHYEQRPSETSRLDFAAGYNYTRRTLEDTGTCRYDWYGRCVRELDRPGEIGEAPSDRVIWEHAAFARLNAAWKPAPNHTLRASAAPTFVTRDGSERSDWARSRRDRLAAQRDLFDFVTGVEYQVDLFGARLQNIAFAKDYLQMASAEEPLASGVMVSRDRTSHEVGFGDSLRYRFNDWSLAKVSYEWATRLPTPEEIFGDAILVKPNLELEPERSHNLNVQLALDDLQTSYGTFRSQLTGFLRHADSYITDLGNAEGLTYQNVFTARAIGAEGSAGWTAPGEVAALDANATYVDLRNISDEGAFGAYEGDRIPNRPYLFANATARLRGEDMVLEGDTVSLAWRTRYVHSFYRGWESVGRAEFKQVIPAQWHHTVALTHAIGGEEAGISTTFEVQNLTDEKLYDFFGVQRPGRAFYVKTTLDF